MLVAACFFLWNGGLILEYMIWWPLMPRVPEKPCTSHRCLEIFTCSGMQHTTRHIREPYILLGGLICGYYGLKGAVGFHYNALRIFAYFLLGIFLLYIFNWFFDLLFMEVCGLYPSNVIYQTLLWKFTNIPIQEDKKATLAEMSVYPVRQVDWMVEHKVWRWSCLLSFIYASLAFYTYQKIAAMARIVFEGPVGLGVNYRLGAWRAEVLIKHWLEQEEDQLFSNALLNDEDAKQSKYRGVEHLSKEGGGHRYGSA